MSECIVPLTTIGSVREHPNADRLEVAEIEGWQVVISRGTYHSGDPVIYVPPDAVVPTEWSDHWGVTQYLSNGRVRSIKLRGEPSLGFSVKPGAKEYAALIVAGFATTDGTPKAPLSERVNVAEAFGIAKYEPPVSFSSGIRASRGMVADNPLFPKYTSIENLRHNPNVFLATDYVVATEKIHGTNSRVGLINGEWMAGSRRMQRLHPSQVLSLPHCETFWQKIKRHVRDFFTPSDVGHITTEILSKTNPGSETYWYPLTLPEVRSLLESLSKDHKQVILYGEIFGPGIQKGFDYGVPVGELGYRAFDLVVDGKFVSYTTLNALCRCYGVQTAPEVYSGYFVSEVLEEFTKGTSLVGGTHIREGVVVRPFQGEETDARLGRKILKLVSTEYLTRNVEDEHEAA